MFRSWPTHRGLPMAGTWGLVRRWRTWDKQSPKISAEKSRTARVFWNCFRGNRGGERRDYFLLTLLALRRLLRVIAGPRPDCQFPVAFRALHLDLHGAERAVLSRVAWIV